MKSFSSLKTILAVIGMLLLHLWPALPLMAGQIYMWMDDKGVQHLSTSPPPKEQEDVKTFAYKERPAAEKKTASDWVSPVHIENNQVLVSATLRYQKREITGTLLLDTGASITVLHRDFAEKLGVTGHGKMSVQVAGGGVLNAEVINLDSLEVGPIERNDIAVTVIDHSGPKTAFVGLLGMNFLKGLDYKIDFDTNRILWKKPTQ